MPPPNGNRCGNCWKWQRVRDGDTAGACRAEPPAIFPVVSLQPTIIPSGYAVLATAPAFQSQWPPISEDGWCAKWEDAPKKWGMA